MHPLSCLILSAAFLASTASAFSPQKLLCLVNQQRAIHHLPPLTYHPQLTAAAQSQSNFQAAVHRMTHSGKQGSTPSRRISAAGYHWNASGENVAYGYRNEEKVMQAWMNSQGHRENILSPKFKSMGAAVAYGNHIPYYTQDFGAGGAGGYSVDCTPFGVGRVRSMVRSVKSWIQRKKIVRMGNAFFRMGKRKGGSHWQAQDRHPPSRRPIQQQASHDNDEEDD